MRREACIIFLCFLVSISMVAAAKRSARKLAVKSDCQIDIEDFAKSCKQWIILGSVPMDQYYCEADCILVRTQCSKEEVLKEAPYFFTPVVDKILTTNGFQPFP
ncbi:unnamed protein product [Cuscuta epithymum]|uniref:Uncharacterized protein n=1 Tax=Cuscuta epithymum TaxID=186058 RepID=A0AAV0CKJ0_9ASTE|nr:unnamed protein product [Cuscuta epithymum]